jgi:uncharacterized protein YkwD
VDLVRTVGIRFTGIAAIAAAALVMLVPAAASADTTCTGDGLIATDENLAEVEAALYCDVNAYRVANGLSAARIDTRLASAGQAHTDDMVANHYLSHTDLAGHGPTFRANAAGYPGSVGEIVASHGYVLPVAGLGTAFFLFNQWRVSHSHNDIMLTANNTAIGGGAAARWCCSSAPISGLTGTEMLGPSPANTGGTGLELQVGPAPPSPFPLPPPGGPGGQGGGTGATGGANAQNKNKKCKRKAKRKKHGKRRHCHRRKPHDSLK